MKTKEILQLFKENGISKNQIKHDLKAIQYALTKFENPRDVFLLVFFNVPFGYTHSYGFQTREGRYYIETFIEYYYGKN